MVAQSTSANWFKNVLEIPFFEAEMARVEMTKVNPGEESMLPVTLLAIYGVGFAVLCSYSVVNYLL